MKFTLVSLLACVVLAMAAANVAHKRFLLDDLTHLAHSVLDPLADTVKDTVHSLVNEFEHLVHGHVVCKMPQETTGTTQDKINACTDNCLSNATSYLEDDAAESASTACPIACKFAYDHPTSYTC